MGASYEFYFRAVIKFETPKEIINKLKEKINQGALNYCGLYALDNLKIEDEFVTYSDSMFKRHELRLLRIAYSEEAALEFSEWVMPYVMADPGDFLGFVRYEGSQELTIIRMKDYSVALDLNKDSEAINKSMEKLELALKFEERIKKIERNIIRIYEKINRLVNSNPYVYGGLDCRELEREE